ncbi:fluoride efflux transporter CrcB [soil metagenome]|nr:fluoride efflux transporter CrcB [Acidobacteriota bacterium]
MMIWILLALGGAAGALARYALASWVDQRTGSGFPLGTLVVNVIGAFLLGVVITGLATSAYQLQLGAFLAVGFLGDFTTFSTFAYETVMLGRQRQWGRALWYVLVSTGLTVLSVMGGMVCGTVLR